MIPNLSNADYERYNILLRKRKIIDRQIRQLIEKAPLAPVKMWGPCTRCGHTWAGRHPSQKPQCCGKCRSKLWDKQRVRPVPVRENPVEMVVERTPVLSPGVYGTPVIDRLRLQPERSLDRPYDLPRGLTPPPPSVIPDIPERMIHVPSPEPAVSPRSQPQTSSPLPPAAGPADGGRLPDGPAEESAGETRPEDGPTDDAPAGAVPGTNESPFPTAQELADGTRTLEALPEEPRCCSKPMWVDGMCINCGTGL